jgi:hypothetical protein
VSPLIPRLGNLSNGKMIGTCSTYRITKGRCCGFIQKSMRVTRCASFARHECIHADTWLKLDNKREVLGRLAVIGAQKHLHSLKVGDEFLYKNDLVYVVLCEDNFGNRDLHPCEDEVDSVMLISRYPDGIELPTKSDRRTAVRTQT